MDENLFINCELSWLEFNLRVLDEARDESVPLLERVKFLAIFSSNLDEFFMVRVARLKRQIIDGNQSIDPDGSTPSETLTAVSRRIHQLADEQHLCFLNTILPQLTAEGIHLVRPEEMSGEQERFLEEFFHRTLYPIVTPLAIDPGHPFPYLANRSLCLVVSLRATGVSRLPYADLSIVHIPSQVVPRFIALPLKEAQHAFTLLQDVLRHFEHRARRSRTPHGGCGSLAIRSRASKGDRCSLTAIMCGRRNGDSSQLRRQEKLYEIIQSEDGISAAPRGSL